MNEQEFIAADVTVEVVHRRGRLRDAHEDVGVSENGRAGFNRVFAGGNFGRSKMAVA